MRIGKKFNLIIEISVQFLYLNPLADVAQPGESNRLLSGRSWVQIPSSVPMRGSRLCTVQGLVPRPYLIFLYFYYIIYIENKESRRIKMFICPTCKKEFVFETNFIKHFLKCWKEKNPNHKSKEAPHSEDIVQKQINSEIIDFFAQFNGE